MSNDGVVRSSKRIIRVTPTLDTSAYAVGDVLFHSLEIPRAVIEKGGCSKLVSMFMFNQNATDMDIDFVFSENTLALGTQNASADVADDALEAGNITGFLFLDSSVSSTSHIDNAEIKRVGESGTGDDSNSVQPSILLQAASDSTSVYLGAMIVAGTPTLAADDIDIILHIED